VERRVTYYRNYLRFEPLRFPVSRSCSFSPAGRPPVPVTYVGTSERDTCVKGGCLWSLMLPEVMTATLYTQHYYILLFILFL
jgi:hypothetical protein